MPEPPKEEPSINPQPEGSHSADGSDIDRIWRERARMGLAQGEAEALKILQDLGVRHGVSLGADVDNPEIGVNSPYNYDAFNQTKLEGSETETPGNSEINTAGITNREILREIQLLNQKTKFGVDPEDYKKTLENIFAITGVDPEGEEGRLNQEKQRAAQALSLRFQGYREERGEIVDRFGFYLETQDLRDLDEDAMGWLDKQFDSINRFAEAGTELDSPVLQRIQTEVGEASAYLQKKYGKFEKDKITTPEEAREAERNARILEYLNRVFAVRLNLIYARTTIEQRGMEQVAGAMGRLKEGLIGSLSFDRGRVGMIFRRMQGELERLRNAEGGKDHHLHPESLNKLQRLLIEEQFKLAKNGLGDYALDYKYFSNNPKHKANADRLLENEITRSVRTAYDVLVATQRVAIIASRGGALADKKQYFSDNGAVFAVFNLEEMSIDKWGLLNHEELKFLEFLKLDLALNQMDYNISSLTRPQLIDLGGRLLKELYTVPDYFSSAWRITGIRDQLTRVMKYKAQNDHLIRKIIEDKDFTSKDTQIMEIGQRLRTLVDKELDKWKKGAHPLEETLKEDEAIVRRNAARNIFQSELNKEERDLLLKVFSPEDADINNFVTQKAGLEDSTDVADFGLFLQLKQNLVHLGDGISKEQKELHRQKVWGKIQTYKTEEMLRIVRTRAKELYSEDMDRLDEMNSMFGSLDPELALTDSEKEVKGGLQAFNSFDKFLAEYGGVIQMVREDAIRNSLDGPNQVDFRHLSNRHKLMVEKAKVGSAQKLKEIYDAMDKFINGNKLIDEFVKSHKYSDLYSRTLSVDDVMLEDLQNMPINSGFLRLEQYWTGEVGGSPTKRNMNDLGNAIEAANAFIAFMTNEAREERYKNSKAMKGKVEAYNGRDNGAQVMRFTYGTEMLYAMQDYFVNALRLGGLPFRQPSSQKQRDYGIGAKSMTRDEIREDLDHHRSDFFGLDGHGKWFTQLEALTETDTGGRLKLQSLTFLFYVFLALGVGIPVGTALASVSASSK